MQLQRSQLSTKILYLLMFFVIFFYPTSLDGIILKSKSYVYVYYGVCIILVMWYVIGKKTSINAVLGLLSVTIYMVIASIVSSIVLGGTIEVSRFVFILLPLFIFFFNSDKKVPAKFVLIINEVLTIIIIFWNICLLFNVEFIQGLTTNYYSQFNWFTTRAFVENSKPVFTFGIYSYGAFFYAMLFIFWMYVSSSEIKNNNPLKNRYYIYAFTFIVFQILMRGSTALFLGIVMLIAFLKRIGRSNWRFLAIPLIIAAGVYFIYVQEFDWTRIILGTSTNGFASRYMSTWFQKNFQAVKETILGIGFTIPATYDLVYSDSGYVVLFTMGNFILPAVLYINLYKSLRRNLPKEIFWLTWIVIMLFELALPGLLYSKEIIFIAYFYMSVQAVGEKNSSILLATNSYVDGGFE